MQNPALDLCDGCGSGDTIQNNYDRRAELLVIRQRCSVPVRVRRFLRTSVWKGQEMDERFDRRHSSSRRLAHDGNLQTQTGLPFTPALSFDAANAGTTTRPNRVCDGNIDNRTLQRWFDTSCFAAPPSYTFGTPAGTSSEHRESTISTSASSAISAFRWNTQPPFSSALKHSISSTMHNLPRRVRRSEVLRME